MQSRRLSLIEALTNIVVGMGIAFVAQTVLLGSFGVTLTHQQNISLVAWMTLISLVRSYCLRRLFNKIRS